jgi:hypothetical protein
MPVQKPAVSCNDCGRTWNSASMAEGLRLLGSCPRCQGSLTFAADAPTAATPAPATSKAVEPHLALGLPRLPY